MNELFVKMLQDDRIPESVRLEYAVEAAKLQQQKPKPTPVLRKPDTDQKPQWTCKSSPGVVK